MNIIYSDKENEKFNKIFILTFDLLLLIIEHFFDNKDIFKNVNELFDCSIFIITNASKFSEDLIIKCCAFLANLVSIKILPFSVKHEQFYEICSKVVFENKDSNYLIKASFACNF